MFPLEFRGEVNNEETRVMGLSHHWKPYDRSLSHFDTIPACVRRSDGIYHILYTLHASYANAG